ncbi:hypothetical protein ACIQVO_05740 [Streptomyces sp. NPDC101062]|uniref:hypothetical protein n=1 Tax=unclassified Streptomyces TaxID=2593676 RepID=UPI0037F8A8AA
MRSAPPLAPRAAAAHAAAVRRAVVVALLVLIAFLGAAPASGSATARAADPLPPASGTPEPGGEGQGEGQQDTAETDQHTDPARTERPARARMAPPDLLAQDATRPPPDPGRRIPAGAPRVAGPTRCTVLRC